MRSRCSVAPPRVNSTCLAADEVAVDRVLGGDAHASVDVHGGVGDPVAALGRPELGHLDLHRRPAARRPVATPPATG